MTKPAKNHSQLLPSAWVQRFLQLAPKGRDVLDLAAGDGRHSRLALELAYPVVALDRDVSGLADLENSPNLEIIEADLEDGADWPLGNRQFGAVIVSNYLYRPILPDIVRAVAPQGILIYATFAIGNEAFGRPRNPDFLLQDGELLKAVEGELVVIGYENGRIEDPAPAVVQRLCAIRSPQQPQQL